MNQKMINTKSSDDDPVTITGISGRYPQSSDITEFWNNLLSGHDLCTEDDSRWPVGYLKLPKRTGKIPNIEKFDSSFFGMTFKEANDMDTQFKICHETTFEAILDAGLDPVELRGSKTGMFIGYCYNDARAAQSQADPILSDFKWTEDVSEVSKYFGFKGPCFTYDSACASSFSAFNEAVHCIKAGVIDTAIVAGIAICSSPSSAVGFRQLGMTSDEGLSKCLDKGAAGYVRSETIATIVLQRKSSAKRVYAQILNSKTCSDGYKKEGITFPGLESMKKLIKETYEEVNLDPKETKYIEAHITGTQAGDPVECNAIEKVFCPEDRQDPVLLGCLKSNMGHAEGASGVAAITKACLVLQRQLIPPNIHYNEPNPNISGLMNGKLKPVTSVTPLVSPNGIISMDSFGFGGTNIHVIIQSNEECLNKNIHDLSGLKGINRLILFKSRTETGFKLLEDTLKNNPSSVTTEFLALVDNVAHLKESNTNKFLYRGYFVLDSRKKTILFKKCEKVSSKNILNIVESVDISFSEDVLLIKKMDSNHNICTQKVEVSKDIKDAVLELIGNLYIETQFDVYIQKLYPKINFPVSRSTLSISPFIKWNHEKDFTVYKVPDYFQWAVRNKTFHFDYSGVFSYLSGHVIDGRILFPAAQYLWSIWQSLAFELVEDTVVAYMETGIKFTNVKLRRAIIVNGRDEEVSFQTRCNPFTGFFEIIQNDATLVTGHAMLTYGEDSPTISDLHGTDTDDKYKNKEEKLIAKKDFYKELRVRGYDYVEEFQGVDTCNFNRNGGNVAFLSNWVCFCDAVFQLTLINDDSRQLLLPTNIECLQIDSKVFKELLKDSDKYYKNIKKSNLIDADEDASVDTYAYEEKTNVVSKEFKVEIIKETREVFTRGMYIKNMSASPAPRRKKVPSVLSFKFHPFNDVCEENKELLQQKMKYINECIDVMTGIGIIDMNNNENIEKIPTEEENIEADEENVEHGLLQTLKKMDKESNNNFTVEDILKYLRRNAENISRDFLLKVPIESDGFKHQFEIVSETFSGKTIKLVEVNLSSKSSLGQETFQQMSREVNYCLFSDEIPPTDAKDGTKNITDLMNIKSIDANIITIQHPSLGFNFLTENIDKTIDSFNQVLDHSLEHMTEGSFIQIIARNKTNEVEDTLSKTNPQDFLTDIGTILSRNSKIISVKQVGSFVSILSRKLKETKSYKTFEVETFNYDWVDSIRREIYVEEEVDDEVTKKPINNNPIYLIAKDNDSNGLSGLIKCLQKEDDRFRGILIADSLDDDNRNDIIHECIKLDLKMVIFKEGKLGSISRSDWKEEEKVIHPSPEVENVSHVLDVKTKGDLSSLKYQRVSLNKNSNSIVDVHYSALNFKDVMVASGRVPPTAYPASLRPLNAGEMGMEFSGIDASGRRVMGFVATDAIATKVDVGRASDFLFEVPEKISLEEAATIPVVYSTVYYALLMRGKLLPGESILIHAGSGGVGQAAINVCQSMGCEVYTTVGTKEKREFIKTQFNLSDDHIFDSRSVSFGDDILRATNGSGVDVVLNSLSEEKLHVGLTCLATNGRFIEIGKYDMITNSTFDPSCLTRNQTFQSVCLAFFMAKVASREGSDHEVRHLRSLMEKGIKDGVVRPLSRRIFAWNQTEEAFRFMASGKHIGKILINMKGAKDERITLNAKKRVSFDPEKTYLLIGGLGGLGPEICHWMVTKGARNIIITSRSGISSFYQEFFIKRLESCFGAKIKVSKLDVSKYEEAEALISEGTKIGPVGGIINMAMVLKDSLFENQTTEKFQQCCSIKIKGTSNLDKLSRQLCPKLDHFICFSSLVSTFGNAGQSNYGYANSFMDNLCTNRRKDGLPGLSIGWGAIGDVGHVAEKMGNDVSVAGTAPQRINSCLDVLENVLFGNDPCVGSYIEVDKSSLTDASKGGNILSSILNVLGIKDHSKVDPKSSLGDLGLDSLMAVEIKQVLEKKYEKILSAKEIRDLTIEQINSMKLTGVSKMAGGDKFKKLTNEEAEVKMIKSIETSKKLFVELNDVRDGVPMFVFPPIEGTFDSMVNILKDITTKTKRPLIGVTWIKDNDKHETIEEIAKYYLENILLSFPYISSFNFISYSFGSLIATQMAMMIMNESKYSGLKVSKLVILDFSPEYGRQVLEGKLLNIWNENDFMSNLSKHVVSYLKNEELGYEKEIKVIPKDDFIQKCFKLLSSTNNKFTEQMFLDLCNKIRRKSKMVLEFKPAVTIKKSLNVLLIKSSTLLAVNDENDDLNKYFGLNQFVESINAITFNGNHKSFLVDNHVAICNEITNYLCN